MKRDKVIDTLISSKMTKTKEGNSSAGKNKTAAKNSSAAKRDILTIAQKIGVSEILEEMI